MIEAHPPKAAARPIARTHHGHTREDPYAWLRDEDWRAAMRDPSKLTPEIRAHLEAENAYLEAVMAPTEALQEALYAEMRARIKEDDSTVPAPDGPFAYYTRYRTGGQYPVIARAPVAGGAEQVLLDGDAEAANASFFRLAGVTHSPDHARLAYAVDRSGAEVFTIRVKDLGSGALLPDELTDARGDLVWAADGRTLFYTTLDDNHRPNKVFRHRLGAPQSDDALVYEEPDPGFFVSIGKTESDRFILIDCHDHTTSETRVLDATTPDGAFTLLEPRARDVRYDVSDHGDQWLIRTNADDAKDDKIVTAPLDAPGRAHWRDLVPHRPGRLIRATLAFQRWLVRLEREDGLPRIVVRDMADGEEHAIAFDEEVYELGLVPGYEYATDTLRFTYSSLTTPQRVFDYDMATRARSLRKEQEVPSGHDPNAYLAKRLFATSHDGEQVPVSLVHRRDTPLDGTAPCLLYGYGAYGITIPAGFATNRLSLVDRGFVYAIAHVRGGKAKGFAWYEAGKLERKPNTFKDFVAVAQHLIAEGYTGKGRIVAQGGSAGGMLMGAVANMAPELFAGIVADVPFVDVLTTMLDDSLPLTPPEWQEWGNPIESEEAYRLLLSYSPYDNVTAQAYPAMLVTAGVSDPRVTYWEPAKWVARLRATKTDDKLLLLKTNMAAGHAGKSGRFEYLREVALAYAFVLRACGRA